MVDLSLVCWVLRYTLHYHTISYLTVPSPYQIYGVVSVISAMAAIWSLTCLTMERAWVIKSISKKAYPHLSMAKMRLVMLAIWFAAVAASIAPLMGWNKYIYEVPSRIMEKRYGKP